MNIKTQYNKIGKNYLAGQDKFFGREIKDMAAKFIKKSLPKLKNKIVLEFGCGDGKSIKLFKKLGAKSVYGIDTSKFMIERAKKNLKTKDNLFIESIEKTHFKNNFFDLVVGRYVLHYLNSFDAAYKEIARVLKRGGIFIFVSDHPLRNISAQKIKKYGHKETIKMGLYNDQVFIHFPSHTLQEYFSREFFKHFHVVNFEEWVSPETKLDALNTPDSFGMLAIKK